MPQEPASNHVQVPQALFHALASCYYGEGPRYADRKGQQAGTPEGLGDLEDSGLDPLRGVSLKEGLPPAWKPRGWAEERDRIEKVIQDASAKNSPIPMKAEQK